VSLGRYLIHRLFSMAGFEISHESPVCPVAFSCYSSGLAAASSRQKVCGKQCERRSLALLLCPFLDWSEPCTSFSTPTARTSITYNGDCDYAVVELTPALVKQIRSRVALARKADSDLYELYFWSSADFFDHVISQYELHAMRYRVEADSEAEAVVKLFDSEGEPIGQSMEFIEVAEDYGLPVDEFPALAKALRDLDVSVGDSIIPSIRSIDVVQPRPASRETAWAQTETRYCGRHRLADHASACGSIRMRLHAAINAQPGSREALEAEHGQVWDPNQLADDFDVIEFSAPLVVVCRKSDGQKGSLFFQGMPRFYVAFEAHE
jgi:hypothetical protein